MSRRIVRHERRLQILDALDCCLRRKSFYETTIKDIAEEAGLPSGVIHYYFKSKEEILLFYIDRIIDIALKKMNGWLEFSGIAAMTPKNAFLETFDFVKRTITLDQGLTKNFIVLWEISLHKPEVKKKIKKAYDIWTENLMSLLRKVSNDEKWISWLSRALIAFLEGASILSSVYGRNSSVIRELFENFEKYHLSAFTREKPD